MHPLPPVRLLCTCLDCPERDVARRQLFLLERRRRRRNLQKKTITEARAATHAKTDACTFVHLVPEITQPICTTPKRQLRAVPAIPDGIFTPLMLAVFQRYHSRHPDRYFVNNLLSMFYFGADIGYRGPRQRRLERNHGSAFADFTVLSEVIAKIS